MYAGHSSVNITLDHYVNNNLVYAIVICITIQENCLKLKWYIV